MNIIEEVLMMEVSTKIFKLGILGGGRFFLALLLGGGRFFQQTVEIPSLHVGTQNLID